MLTHCRRIHDANNEVLEHTYKLAMDWLGNLMVILKIQMQIESIFHLWGIANRSRYAVIHIAQWKETNMKKLTLEQTADYLESSKIEKSINMGFANVHIGISPAGIEFVLVSDVLGEVVLAESM